ncbi:SRPBCC family protein [Amycolatopsis cynarae]|uniref:SRPBCC family protein n=1 Tax=Amycolatopsis cynarae TaxID=2995223 RepID=A0ABY7B968_9PSEU|nr:SRPBCC family protein [Amycolatopsis sp. HUAS 11-8]WAL68912.1 SRPBCC family protein [Amycolatopsis sp. HUAS 11-8]
MVTNQLKNVAGKVEEVGGKVAEKATGKVGEVVGSVAPSNPLGDSLRGLAETVTAQAANAMARKISSTAGRLTEYAAGGAGSGLGGLLGALVGEGTGVKRKAVLGALKGGLGGIADNVKEAVKGAFGMGGRGSKNKIKLTNIVEQIDIGAPVDLVYDQWTLFTDFPTFMKKVEHVEQVSDEKLVWKAQVFWSHRTWDSTILEQVPGERIIWRSEGKKGYVDGAVTFHELTPDLTRVVLVLEYHPQGLFERTGNLWRAQGRRVRLELKHFQRHVMAHVLLHPEEVEGWPGEIHDGHVVRERESEEDRGGAAEEGRREEEPEKEPEEEPVPKARTGETESRERAKSR